MKLIIDIPEELYRAYKDRPPMLGDAGIDMIAQAIANGTRLYDLRDDLEDNITHSPYIKSFIDCCRLRDDAMRITDKYRSEVNE